MLFNPAAPGGAASAPAESAAEAESEGVWTGWFNDMNPYEEGQKGDLELRKDMDPVSNGQYWTFSMDDISIVHHSLEFEAWTLTLHPQIVFKCFYLWKAEKQLLPVLSRNVCIVCRIEGNWSV